MSEERKEKHTDTDNPFREASSFFNGEVCCSRNIIAMLADKVPYITLLTSYLLTGCICFGNAVTNVASLPYHIPVLHLH